MARLLELRRACTGYGQLPILHNADFHIDEGEVVALLGRNGMGKTTCLKAMAGWLGLWSGQHLWRGADISHKYKRGGVARYLARDGLLLIPEDRGIFARLTAEENFHLIAGQKQKAEMELRFPELRDKWQTMGDGLSGGERQILSLARALSVHPSLLLLDETTEGLSPRVAERIWQILDELRKAGQAFVVVDKNWQRVATLADRVLFLAKGQIVESVTGNELRAHPEIAERHLGL